MYQAVHAGQLYSFFEWLLSPIKFRSLLDVALLFVQTIRKVESEMLTAFHVTAERGHLVKYS